MEVDGIRVSASTLLEQPNSAAKLSAAVVLASYARCCSAVTVPAPVPAPAVAAEAVVSDSACSATHNVTQDNHMPF